MQASTVFDAQEQFMSGDLIGDDLVFLDDDEDVGDVVVAPFAAVNECSLSSSVPAPSSVVWARMPPNMVSVESEPGTLAISHSVLLERKSRFSDLVVVFLASFVAHINESNPFSADCDWNLVPVTFFVASFLSNVDLEYLAQVICAVVVDEAQYVLMDPMFKPEMLLGLPKISKKDYVWGCYMDIFTGPGQIVYAWYTGSATGFSSAATAKPAGILGRLLSYFAVSDRCRTSHEHWLQKCQKDSHNHKPNFRKIADFSKYHTLHRVYVFIVEQLIMCLTSFDVEYQHDHRWVVKNTPDWVKRFRDQHGVKLFPGVDGLNHALPLKQGIPFDKRFGKSSIRQCSNPVANCAVTSSDRWHPLNPGQVLSNHVLCGPCWKYRRNNCGQHRPQALIDMLATRHRDQVANNCGWCLEPLPAKAHESKNTVGVLNITLCKSCNQNWREQKSVIPIIGIHFDAGHAFVCQGGGPLGSCGRTQARQWYFESKTGLEGVLNCELCHTANRQVIGTEKTAKQVLRKIKTPAHTLGQDDVKKFNVTGYLEYCAQHLGIDLRKALGNDEKRLEVRRVMAAVLEKDTENFVSPSVTLAGSSSSSKRKNMDMSSSLLADESTLLDEDTPEDTTLLSDNDADSQHDTTASTPKRPKLFGIFNRNPYLDNPDAELKVAGKGKGAANGKGKGKAK